MQVAAVVSRTQIERGRTALYLSSNLTNEDALNLLVNEDRRMTDENIRKLTWWPKITMTFPYTQTFNTVHEFLIYFNDTFRVEVLEGKWTFKDSILFFTDLNKHLLDVSLNSIKVPSSEEVSDLLFAFNSLMRATENSGITRAVGSTFFAPCYLTREFMNWFISLEAKIDNCLDFAAQYFPPSRDFYDQKLNQSGSLFDWVQLMRRQMTTPEYYPVCEEQFSIEERFDNGHKWFTNITEYVWVLTDVHDYVGEILVQETKKVRNCPNDISTTLALMLVTMVIIRNNRKRLETISESPLLSNTHVTVIVNRHQTVRVYD